MRSERSERSSLHARTTITMNKLVQILNHNLNVMPKRIRLFSHRPELHELRSVSRLVKSLIIQREIDIASFYCASFASRTKSTSRLQDLLHEFIICSVIKVLKFLEVSGHLKA